MNLLDFLKNEYSKRNWSITSNRSCEQITVIERLINGENLLLVQATGWGKTIVYALTTKFLRKTGVGPTVIISPTIDLINDQIAALSTFDLECVTLNHTNKNEHESIYTAIKNDAVDVILVSAEKATDDYFLRRFGSPALCVCDECHIISEVGHDFRPKYAELCKFFTSLNKNARILATSATVDNNSAKDVRVQLGKLKIIRGILDKPNHSINVIEFNSDDDCSDILKNKKIEWLNDNLFNIFKQCGRGIIYCRKIETVDKLYSRLNDFNRYNKWELHIGKYYSDDENFFRDQIFKALKQGDIDIMICTGPSLGIGIDLDFGFTIHFDPPMSIPQLYQEIGRAGRTIKNSKNACSYIMYSPKSKSNIMKTIHSNAIDPNIAKSVYSTLQKGNATDKELKAVCNIEKNDIKFRQAINILTSCKCIKEDNGAYRLNSSPLDDVFDKDEKITKRRINAFNDLLSCILSKKKCIMQQLRIALGDPTPNIQPCGKCSVCKSKHL